MAAPLWATDDVVRQRIENALPASARDTLRNLIAGSAAIRRGWLSVPAWRQTFGTLAALAVVDEARAVGDTVEQGYARAAARLGVPLDTVTGWIKRARDYARKGST